MNNNLISILYTYNLSNPNSNYVDSQDVELILKSLPNKYSKAENDIPIFLQQ